MSSQEIRAFLSKNSNKIVENQDDIYSYRKIFLVYDANSISFKIISISKIITFAAKLVIFRQLV